MAIDDELKTHILRYHFVEHWRVDMREEIPAIERKSSPGNGGKWDQRRGVK